MRVLLILTFLPPILINTWHILVTVRRNGEDKPLTISEHAAERENLLFIHRLAHVIPLIVFVPFVLFYLLPEGHILAGALLALAALFDALEVLTLNKRTAPLSSGLNAHYITAWLMAASYMMYAVAISRIAGLSSLIYGSFVVVCFVLMTFAVREMFKKYFLAMQMTFFILLSLLFLLAHSVILINL